MQSQIVHLKVKTSVLENKLNTIKEITIEIQKEIASISDRLNEMSSISRTLTVS